jgi:Raf kinase inhibitor-like YbhB/YbcL family protein
MLDRFLLGGRALIVGAAILGLFAAGTGCSSTTSPATPNAGPTLAPPGTAKNLPVLSVTSTSFTSGGSIPFAQAFTGCGNTGTAQNLSTDIAWTAGPTGTASYVLTEFDTDAPTGVGFWHWTIFNIPPTVTSLALNATTSPPAGSIQGYNDYGFSGYGGPCPPVGDPPHHYYFTVSALNSMLSGVTASATGAFLTFNMDGKVIAQGQLLGRYGR